jgi:surface antigen
MRIPTTLRGRLALTAVAGMAATAALPVASALAATGTVLPGGPYPLRSAPHLSAAKVGERASGVTVSITCTATGDAVTGKYGTTRLWDKLANGAYISDAQVYTGTDGAAAPACGAAGGQATLRGDDYPYRNSPMDQVDRWDFYTRECTSFAAWRLNQDGVAFTDHYKGVLWGDASHWDDAARSVGVTVNHTPQAGAIAEYESDHVAYVARSNGDGTIVIEDYNSNYDGRYDSRTVSVSRVSSFIHFR